MVIKIGYQKDYFRKVAKRRNKRKPLNHRKSLRPSETWHRKAAQRGV